MTDKELAQWLRERRGAITHEDCVRIEGEVQRRSRKLDAERGEWINPHEFPHHYGEAAQH